MAVISVYSEPVRRRYSAQRCSHACIFQLVISIILIVCPFFVALHTHSFWKTRGSFTEQPSLVFGGDAFVLATGKVPGEGYAVSTNREFNEEFNAASSSLPSSSSVSSDSPSASGAKSTGEIGVTPIDEDADGIMDRFRVRARIPVDPNGGGIVSASVAVVFQYNLTSTLSALTDCAVFHTMSSPVPGSRMFADGDITLVQKKPRAYASMFLDTRRLVNSTITSLAGSPQFMESLITASKERDMRTVYKDVHSVWTPSHAADAFEVDLIVRVPQDEIVYIPGFWETVKLAWVQYIAIFFIFWFFIHHLRAYVFRYQVVETTVLTDVVPKIKPF